MEKLKEIEKMYNFDFNAEMQKMKADMIDYVERTKDYDAMRDVLCKALNNPETKYRLNSIFNEKYVHFLFPHNSDCNKIELVFAMEDFIERTHYNIIDDGQLFFVKATKIDKKNNFNIHDYFFTHHDIHESKNWIIENIKNEFPYFDDVKLDYVYINSIELFINILKEVLDENNYYYGNDFDEDEEPYKMFDKDKAFEKFFEKK